MYSHICLTKVASKFGRNILIAIGLNGLMDSPHSHQHSSSYNGITINRYNSIGSTPSTPTSPRNINGNNTRLPPYASTYGDYGAAAAAAAAASAAAAAAAAAGWPGNIPASPSFDSSSKITFFILIYSDVFKVL